MAWKAMALIASSSRESVLKISLISEDSYLASTYSRGGAKALGLIHHLACGRAVHGIIRAFARARTSARWLNEYHGLSERGFLSRSVCIGAEAFPRTRDFSDFDKVFPKKKVGELPDAETLRAVQSLTRVLMATKNLKGGFGYKSDGVKLGDADKILFWYRPEGATQFRALYGDLHAADVTEDKLPEKPKP